MFDAVSSKNGVHIGDGEKLMNASGVIFYADSTAICREFLME